MKTKHFDVCGVTFRNDSICLRSGKDKITLSIPQAQKMAKIVQSLIESNTELDKKVYPIGKYNFKGGVNPDPDPNMSVSAVVPSQAPKYDNNKSYIQNKILFLLKKSTAPVNPVDLYKKLEEMAISENDSRRAVVELAVDAKISIDSDGLISLER